MGFKIFNFQQEFMELSKNWFKEISIWANDFVYGWHNSFFKATTLSLTYLPSRSLQRKDIGITRGNLEAAENWLCKFP